MNLALSGVPMQEKVATLSELWGEVEESDLFKHAQIDEVASHIAFILKETNIQYASYWDEEYQKVNHRITVLMEVLDEVATELKKNNIEIVALKNGGITKAIYKNNACSPMGDLDLLVRSKDFNDAHKIILEKLGFTFKFRSVFEEEDLEEAFRGGGTEYYKDVQGYKVWLELQWRPIAGRWIQPHNEPNGDELIDNSVEAEGSAIRILNPEDNLLQVALHTAKHSYVRAPGFRLHSDVDRIVRFQKIDWTSFEKKVRKLKLTTAVYFSLYFAKDLLVTPIPDSTLKNLKPVWFRRKTIHHYINKAGIYNQKKKKFSRVGYILFNLSLYDSLSENIKAIFPPLDSIKIKYPITKRWQLPYFYIKRIRQLIFQRAQL